MTLQLDMQAFFHGGTSSLTYLISDPQTRQAAVIDPVLDYDWKRAAISTRSAEAVLAAVRAGGLTLSYVLETHVHADHLTAANWLKEQTGAKVAIGERVRQTQAYFAPLFGAEDLRPDGSAFDRLLADGERLELGGQTLEVIAIPGHTADCVGYRCGDTVFLGDSLFMPDVGTARADFPGGDAVTLHHSLRRILALPPKTRLFMCHDYPPAPRTAPAWETTVAAEREHNIQIRDGVSEADYVARRQARDATLEAPALILPALQVNIRAGRLPPPGPDGKSRLQLPVNTI